MAENRNKIILLHGSSAFTEDNKLFSGLEQGELIVEHGNDYAKLHTKSENDKLVTFVDEKAIEAITNPISSGLTELQDSFEEHVETKAVTGDTNSLGHVKLVSGDLKDKTYADGEAAAAAHTHSNYALTGHTHESSDITDTIDNLGNCESGSTELVQGKVIYQLQAAHDGLIEDINESLDDHKKVSGSTNDLGHVKLVSGDLKDKTYADGEAAAAAHTHSNYALTGHTHESSDITDTIDNLGNCESGSTELVQGKVIYQLQGTVESNSELLEKLVAEDDNKSIREIAKSEVDAYNDILMGSGATAAIDSLKDVLEWIGENPNKEAAEIISDIVELQGTVTGYTSENTIQKAISGLNQSIEGITEILPTKVDSGHTITFKGGTDLSGNTDVILGSTEVTLNWEVVDNSHNHVSDNITDAISKLEDCESKPDKLVEASVITELQTIVEGIGEGAINEIIAESYENSVSVSKNQNTVTIDFTNMVINGGTY